jgi:5-methylcytosine-specific restriction endonuclease McrA
MYASRCYVCGGDDRVTVDHVKPVAHGGMHCLSNFRPMCKSCNSIKGTIWPMPLSLLRQSPDGAARKLLLRATRKEYERTKDVSARLAS